LQSTQYIIGKNADLLAEARWGHSLSTKVPSTDVVVIGGGAAGLFAAIHAARRGRSVVLIEHAPEVGRKIRISGGGRCNFTNLHCRAEHFLSDNPHFVKSALAQYGAKDFIALVESHKIPYEEKTLGQLFCNRSSEDILSLLARECSAARVEIRLGTTIHGVTNDGRFQIRTSTADFSSESLVVATGGLSIPKLGATDFGYQLARQFGHTIVPCRPALVPLTFNAEDQERFNGLAGVAFDSVASIGKRSFREKSLITHRGVSGPAILQISSYWQGGELNLDLAAGLDQRENLEELWLASKRQEPSLGWPTLGSRVLPRRLAERLLPPLPMREAKDKELRQMAQKLRRWPLSPAGTEGYTKAEVTAGGVNTRELYSENMMSRRLNGLFFVGEVVDVTGHLGGYNFQWAWSSGFACGQVA
jgi:predicted Rossmann fold flavoprotein